MAALHIRDISDTLLKDLKVHAAECGLTLKQYVVGKLAMPSGWLGGSRVIGNGGVTMGSGTNFLEGSNGEGNGSGTVEPERSPAVGQGKRRKGNRSGRSAKPVGVAAEASGTGLDAVPQGQGITPKIFSTQRVTSRDDACANCGHARIKHRDGLLACLENVCRCPGFVEAEMVVAG